MRFAGAFRQLIVGRCKARYTRTVPTARYLVSETFMLSGAYMQPDHVLHSRRAKADSWAGQAQTKLLQAWAHVAYRVQYSRYLAFYCLICAGLGELRLSASQKLSEPAIDPSSWYQLADTSAARLSSAPVCLLHEGGKRCHASCTRGSLLAAHI